MKPKRNISYRNEVLMPGTVPNFWRWSRDSNVCVMRLEDGRSGAPGNRYTYRRYSVTGTHDTFRTLEAVCKYLRQVRVTKESV